MEEFSDLECDICSNMYTEDHCPRLLPCSHTFCGPCIDGLISAGKQECPVCRKTFKADSAQGVAINRSLLNVAKQLSSMHLASVISSRAPKKPFLETTRYFRETVIKKGIAVCEETEVEVNGRIDSNNKMRGGLEGFIQKLDEIKLSSKETWNNIGRDDKLLMDKLDIMKGKGRQMKDSEDKLEAATDFASAGSPMDEAGKVLQEVDETANEIKQLLQENKDNMKQDIFKIGTDLEGLTKDLGRIIEELDGDSVVSLTVTELRGPHVRFRVDAQRKIFAVKTFEGKLRVAPVKIESNNQLYVNHLQEGVLPPKCFAIELDSLVQGSSSSPPRAFLDLTYGSTHLGRVIIRIIDQGGQLGLNFIQMCSGRMGPSYANSQVFEVRSKGVPGEDIGMGEYVSHGGGTSAQAVLSSKEDWEREMSRKTYEETLEIAGELRGDISYEGASQFWIVTRDGSELGCGYCFGKVEEGLNVLRDAISKHPDHTKIKVAQCGLVFCL
ncbi:uncharacterized protein [Macrobrachium rosenbergii]|uniref:uncharacterized protein isoform X2 n=1 Tax=Macrobrachium rosenbergii TaxID=79674 RepID=UPI0034D4A344